MNCTECREFLVPGVDEIADAETAAACERHLATCAECRAEKAAHAKLHRRLAARAETAAGVALAAPVMARIHESRTASARRAPSPYLSWMLGLGTAAAACAVIALLVLSPDTKAQAVDVMNRGIVAAARLTSVHLQANVRSRPADNFSSVKATAPFSPIELWKEFDGQKRWRVEKPGRVAVMDGESTLLFIRNGNTALRFPRPSAEAFDTGWIHRIADIEQTLTHALKMAQTKNWKMELTKSTDTNGVVHANVTIDAVAGVPADDYLANKFLDLTDSRRVFRFDDATGALESLQVYLRQEGDLRLILEVTSITYNQPIPAEVFRLELPADVAWARDPQPVANNEKYAAMTAQQAARTFFEACGREDWTEAVVFFPGAVPDVIKKLLGGATIISIGEPFSSAASPGQFVPYELQLRNGKVMKQNLALQKHPRAGRWIISGGI